jgi:DNA repair and recombination RAD54-like protein
VDGSSSAESSSAKFTKEELRDCFTLKEDCECDTKRKLGKHWLEYGKSSFYTRCIRLQSLKLFLFSTAGGAEGLAAQNCDDAPLISVANDQSEILSFVHVVTEEELVVPESGDTSEQTEDVSEQEARLSSDEECEFVDDENNSKDDETHGLSGEEYEFDE